MPASQPKRFANNLALAESAPHAPDSSFPAGTKAPVIQIESAGAEGARGVSRNDKLRQWIERNIIVLRVDWIAMAAAIALLPIGALILVRTNKLFPKSLQKSGAITRVSVPLAQTRAKQALPTAQDKPALASQTSAAHKSDGIGVVSDVRYTSDSGSAVVTLDLDQETKFEVHRISSPERIYVDLHNTKLAPVLFGKEMQTQDGLLRAIRVGEHERQTTRITLATAQICDYSVTRVPNSSQLRLELRKAGGQQLRRVRGNGLTSDH